MAAPTKKRYSLLLINPKRRYRYHWDLKELCVIMRKRTAVHPLALPTVAALTPDHYDIRILDEEMEPIQYEPRPDIVGLTGLGPSIKRGYEIADDFREMGIPVVMGGAQVSFNVEETLKHADSVVIGEAEGVWQECLADFEKGALKPRYKREQPFEFTTPSRPRWDLVNTSKIMALGVEASRGCPFRCDFCLVRNMFGRKQRYRALDDLVDEIKSLPKKQIGFVDDNFTGNKEYARQLMVRLKPLGVTWSCQCSMDVCNDEPLLRDMAEAGCNSILLGIESLNPESIAETAKYQNKVEEYEGAIHRVHRNGIHVIGSFIVGFDADRLDAFDRIFEFTNRTNISLVMLNVLTAYPGTDHYDRLLSEGRITDIDPDLLNGIYPTMRHRHVSQTDMFTKYFETMEKMFSCDVVLDKALRVFDSGAFCNYNSGDISVADKLFSILHLINRFLLTNDRHKHRLLTGLFSRVRQKRAAVGNVVEFLLLISSFIGYLEFTKDHRTRILEKISRSDPGPLEAQEGKGDAELDSSSG